MINILVSATAARSSGALSILNQFIEHIPNDNSVSYYIFVDISFKPILKKNVNYIYINTLRWINRILWDFCGLKRWSDDNKIKANLIISFQNTGIKYDKTIPQIIYFHNLLAISEHKWSFFSKTEFLFYLYKKIYPYFVSLYLKESTHIIVQAPFIKELFLNKFSVKSSNVHIVHPEINMLNFDEITPHIYTDDLIHFIYPATPYKYKNHLLLVEALSYLSQIDSVLLSKIRIHLTIKKEEYPGLYYKIKQKKLIDSFVFEGKLTYKQLVAVYKSSRALLFPSYIETVGLPLLEVANIGIPIIVSDLPYAHDAINGYSGADFINYKDAISWGIAIKERCLSNFRYFPFASSRESNDWKSFFILVNSLKVI